MRLCTTPSVGKTPAASALCASKMARVCSSHKDCDCELAHNINPDKWLTMHVHNIGSRASWKRRAWLTSLALRSAPALAHRSNHMAWRAQCPLPARQS